MRKIEKQSEPTALTNYRNEQKKNKLALNFENLPADVKAIIKKSLLEEQGYLCCYCMKKIEYDTMKVEHFKTQNQNQELVLDYHNLLGACEGNQKHNDKAKHHCDTCKGGDDFNDSFKSPASKDFNLKISYVEVRSQKTYEEGKMLIKSADFQVEFDCNKIKCDECKKENDKVFCHHKEASLNLNEIDIIKKRYRIWKGVTDELSKASKKETWSPRKAQELIEKYQTKKEGKYPEFCEMVVFLLKKRFKNELEKTHN
ncbi:MAG: TIGR02646 family protein [Cytophagales bacterium]|nr:MAG: TIGR02646 family protein [Cytophagales bacterium]